MSLLGRDEERARLERTTEILARVAGQRPSGWFSLPRPGDKFAGGAISPHTIDLLIEGGYDYFGNGLADDVPHYWVSDFASRRAILTLPYYYHFDDQFFLLFPRKGTGLENPDALFRNWKAELDAQYKRGRQFSMVLHPHAHRLAQPAAHAGAVPRPCAEACPSCGTRPAPTARGTGARPSPRPRISSSSRRSGRTIPAA